MSARQCFAILPGQFHPEHGFIPSLVTEDEPGHQPLIGADELALPWYWGKTMEEAQAVADERNQSMYGLSPEEAKAIIDSSLAASIRQTAAEERVRADYERKLGRH